MVLSCFHLQDWCDSLITCTPYSSSPLACLLSMHVHSGSHWTLSSLTPQPDIMRCCLMSGIPSVVHISASVTFGNVSGIYTARWWSYIRSEHSAGMLLPQRHFVVNLVSRLPLRRRSLCTHSSGHPCPVFLRDAI